MLNPSSGPRAARVKHASLVITFALSLLALGAVPAGAAFPGDNGKIAFDSDRESIDPEEVIRREVFSINPDGSAQTRLTNEVTCSADPAWSADGAKLVFVRDELQVFKGPFLRGDVFQPCDSGDLIGEIWTMNADGSNQQRLTAEQQDADPAWSPNGTKIVFRRDNDEDNDIFTMDANGANQQDISSDIEDNDETNYDDLEPAWSPNGQRIAFGSFRNGDHRIHTMNPDGTGVVNVSDSIDEQSEGVDDRHPDWAPDGSKIAFRRDTPNDSIWSMNADGGGAVNLTPDGEEEESDPAFSPDGTRITFTRSAGENNKTAVRGLFGRGDIYTMAAGGGDERNLDQPGNDQEVNPNWQPIPRQTTTPTTPTTPAPPVARDTRRPRVSVAGRIAGRRACTSSSRLRVPVRIAERGGIRSVRVSLDGRRILSTSRLRFTIRINARRLRAGRHRVRIVAIDGSGNRTTVNRVFARCAQRVAPVLTG